MTELKDYSGAFKPDAVYQDFSSETLARLSDAYVRIYLMTDGLWWGIAREKFGDQEAFQILKSNCLNTAKSAPMLIMGALNIQGNDVANLFKCIQMNIAYPGGPMNARWELKNPNRGVLTVLSFSGLDYFKKHFPDRVDQLCRDLIVPYVTEYTKSLNPEIQVTPVEVPPHKREKEFAFRLEFELDVKVSEKKEAQDSGSHKQSETGKLVDYSGAFNPDLRCQDLSSEALGRLCNAQSMIYLAVLAPWDAIPRARLDFQEALKTQKSFWAASGPHELKWISKALELRSKDVSSVFKFLQMHPGFNKSLFNIQWDLKDATHGIMTVPHCHGLDYLAMQNATEWIEPMCQTIEFEAFKHYASFFNPEIKVTPLIVPPHDRQDEISCQWEFKV